MAAKFALVVPAYCAACFGQNSEARHIDFESAYDGPVLTLEDGRKQPIDDLVICEACLSEAFALLDPQELKQRIAELEGLVERMQADIDAKDGTIQRLGISTTELIEHPIQRQAGYASPGGVPPEVSTYLTQRKRDRTHSKRVEAGKKAAATAAAKEK